MQNVELKIKNWRAKEKEWSSENSLSTSGRKMENDEFLACPWWENEKLKNEEWRIKNLEIEIGE